MKKTVSSQSAVSPVCASLLPRWRCVHQPVWGLWGSERPSSAWRCPAEEDFHFPVHRTHSVPHQQEWCPSSVLLDDVAQPARGGPELIEVCAYAQKLFNTDNAGMKFWLFFLSVSCLSFPSSCVCMNQVKLPAVFFFCTSAWVSINSSGVRHFLSVCNSLFFPVPLIHSDPYIFCLCFFFLPFTSPSFLLFSRESSVIKQREEEEERERLLLQCESDPTAIHGLPLLSRSLQERRSQSVQDNRLAFSHSCITVEPAVGLCVCVSVYILSLLPSISQSTYCCPNPIHGFAV